MIGRIAYGTDFIREVARVRDRLRVALSMFNGRTRVRPVDIYLRADNSLHLALVCLVDEVREAGTDVEHPEESRVPDTHGPVNYPKLLSLVGEVRDDLEKIASLIVGRRGRSVPHVKRAAKSVATLYEALRSESMNPLPLPKRDGRNPA